MTQTWLQELDLLMPDPLMPDSLMPDLMMLDLRMTQTWLLIGGDSRAWSPPRKRRGGAWHSKTQAMERRCIT